MPAHTQTVDGSPSGAAAGFEAQLRGLLGEIGGAVGALAAAQAVLIRLLSRFAALRPPAEFDPASLFDEYAPEEVAEVLGVSARSAYGQMAFAHTVCHRLPHAVQALADGALDLQRLRSLESSTSPLADELAAQVEARVLAGGPRRTRDAFTAACRRAVLRADPHGAAARAAQRRAQRRVWISPGEDATSRLNATVPAEDAAACYERIDRIARDITRHHAAEARSPEQIRADVLVDLLTGRATHAAPLSCEVQVVVPVTTLLGLSGEPGEIPGYGPVPAAVAREMAMRPGSTWRRILTDPQGTLLEIADRRFPSPAQVRHVRARNRRCTHPTCTRPAARTDTDHTRPHAAGGPTVTGNLGPACPKHHRLRHHPDRPWVLRQPHPGTFTWTSPAGVTSTTYPHNYLTGEEDPTPGPGHVQ